MRPPIGGIHSQIAPYEAVSAVSIFGGESAYFPLFARGMRFPSVLVGWGSNPPVSARGCPVTQGSCRASPHKPRKSPQDYIESYRQSPGTIKF